MKRLRKEMARNMKDVRDEQKGLCQELETEVLREATVVPRQTGNLWPDIAIKVD